MSYQLAATLTGCRRNYRNFSLQHSIVCDGMDILHVVQVYRISNNRSATGYTSSLRSALGDELHICAHNVSYTTFGGWKKKKNEKKKVLELLEHLDVC